MSWIRSLYFLSIGIVGTSLFGVAGLELLFGKWLREDKWSEARQLNIVRDRKVVYRVDNLYGKDNPTVLYSRDTFGLRGSCPDPKDINILSMGGSTTDQRFIGDGDTYQDVLQAHLRKRLKRTVCVSNAGVDGHSTFGHIESFRKWLPLIPNLKPEFVLLYIGINDAGIRLTRNSGFDMFERDGESRIWATLREKSALFELLTLIRDLLVGRGVNSAYARHAIRPPSVSDYLAATSTEGIDALIQVNSEAFSNRLQTILSEIERLGAKPICVSQPHLFVLKKGEMWLGTLNVFTYQGRSFNGLDYGKSLDSLNEVMKKRCKQARGFYVDVASKPFAATDFYDAAHLTPVGARKLGKYLFDEMESQGIVGMLQQ